MTEVRAFIAIELPEALRLKISRLETELREAAPPDTKWVNPNGIHLTLKFLGSIPEDRVPRIIQAIEGATKGISPISLRAEGLGVFPNLKRSQVVWVGVAGELERLIGLQKRIDASLAPLGFAPESRPFTAHLTLARARDQMPPQDRERLGRLVINSCFEATAFTANGVSLMRSELRRDGAVYTRLNLSRLTSSKACGDGR